MCYYIIQNIIETIRHLVPRLLLQRWWSLGTTLALPRRRTECRLDFHHATVSRGHIVAPAGPSVRSNARLSVALCDRPESREGRSIWKSSYVAQDAYGLQRADIVRVLPVAFNLCRLAEPRPRIRECLTPRVYLASQSNAISHVA